MAADRARSPALKPGYRGFLAFCRAIGEDLEPHQRKIARAHFTHRKTVAILPKGNHKTTTCALIGLHHLLTTPEAEVRIGAASRRQAEICLRRMKGFARHPLVRDRIKITHFELRDTELGGELAVVSAEGERLHGDSPSLLVGDEVFAWSERAGLLEAFETSLLKREGARMILISTAASSLDTPLGRLRKRALQQRDVKRKGAVTEAIGEDLHWLEWSCKPEDLDNMRKVKAANAAKYLTIPMLREQACSLPRAAFGQFHACVWSMSESSLFQPGQLQAVMHEDTEPAPGDAIYVGVDMSHGGERSDSAVAFCDRELNFGVSVYEGMEGMAEAVAKVRELAADYRVQVVATDFYGFGPAAVELANEGLNVRKVGMTDANACPMAARLRNAVIEQRIRLPDDEAVRRHFAGAVAEERRRGFRVGKASRTSRIDAVSAIQLALAEAETAPAPPRLLGWV